MLLALFFVFAVAADHLTMLWHAAKDNKQPVKLVGISMALESLGWIAIWFALSGDEDPWIAAVSIAGSGCGTALGYCRVARQNRNTVVEPPIPLPPPRGLPPL